jgi:hypothetical protein
MDGAADPVDHRTHLVIVSATGRGLQRMGHRRGGLVMKIASVAACSGCDPLAPSVGRRFGLVHGPARHRRVNLTL